MKFQLEVGDKMDQGLHLPSPMLPATLGRVPLHDHNPLGLTPVVAPMEGIPSFSSYTTTHPPQPSLLNNKTPAPILTYHKRKNTPSVASLIISPGAIDLPSPVVSVKRIGKENSGRRVIILEPKPPQGSGMQKQGRKIVILSPKQQHQGNHDLLTAKEGFDPSPLGHADKAISVTEAPVVTRNPSGQTPSLVFEGKSLPTLQVLGTSSLASSQKEKKRKPSSLLSPPVEIPSAAKRRRSDRARSNRNGKNKADWIAKSAMKILTSECTLNKPQDTESTRARRTRPCAEKLTVSLSKEEIRNDFLLMTGQQPRQRPAKRPVKVQRAIEELFPGAALVGSVVSVQRYNRKT